MSIYSWVSIQTGKLNHNQNAEIKIVSELKYLEPRNQKRYCEIAKRLNEERKVIGMLNSILGNKSIVNKTKKLNFNTVV